MLNFIKKKYSRLLSSSKVLKINFILHKFFGEDDLGNIGFNFQDKPNRFEIIQKIIITKKYRSYLEIGCFADEIFNKIKIQQKVGVDPVSGGTIRKTSDDFFKSNSDKFDCIFIDGLHVMEQTDRDIPNALKHLNEGGIIMMHDCNPPTEKHTITPRVQKAWNGTVFKTWIKMRCTRDDLKMFVIDSDWGCGIIQKGEQKVWDKDSVEKCIDYSYLEKNRESLLNLISADEFNNLFRKKEWWEQNESN